MIYNKRIPAFLIITWLTFTIIGNVFAQPYSQNRDEIPDQYKWNFSDIYADWNEWEKDLSLVERDIEAIIELKGTLAEGPEKILESEMLFEKLRMKAERLFRYPGLMRSVDMRNQEYAARLQQVQGIFAKFGPATAWIAPEILEIPWETMEKWFDETPELAPYRFGMEDLYRQQAHVLDKDKERLLAFYRPFRRTPSSIYSELSTSDIKFPTVTLSTGEEIELTTANYGKIIATNRNQADRKEAFEGHYTVYADNQNTYAAIFNSVCQRDWSDAQARDYNSSLEETLDEDNVPIEVFENLIKMVKANAEPLQRYMKLRQKALGLDEYHSYDGAITLVEFDKKYPYEQAKEWVVESVAPLGESYQQKMRQAVSEGWLDVFESTGKRPGAFSGGVYGVHPYMLLNYNETLSSVFTLAHELGHTLHTLLADENQPYATHSYTLFVAEVASTFNEKLLLDYLMEKTTDPRERITLLQHSIDEAIGTFCFASLMADFEVQVHRLVEQGQPVTAEVLNQVMQELYQAYYAETVVDDKLRHTIWARINHFFSVPYYVYQYATCFASSAQIYDEVSKGPAENRKAATERYLNLLKSGGNDYPMEQLKKAGVDLSDPETILAIINQIDELVTMLETEIEKL